MHGPPRAAILAAIVRARGTVLELAVDGLDVLLVGLQGDNYVLLLPEGAGLTEAERAWLRYAWEGHREACWTVPDALSAIEVAYRERMVEEMPEC